MRAMRSGMLLGVFLAGASVAGGGLAEIQAPRIGKPIKTEPREMAPLPPAVIDNELAIGGDDIRARKIETRMTVNVMVNGQGPYRFLVDSGADTSVVGLKVARDLNLPLTSPAIMHATTASAIVDRVKIDELTMGGTTIHNLEVPALREDDVGGDGMIGIDALVQQRLLMDFERKLIKAEDARVPAKMLDGEIVVTARRRRGQLILTQVTAAGLPVEAVIDTGSEITIGNTALRDKLLRGNRNRFTKVRAMGVTGVTIELQIARIAELKVGSITLKDVPIAFADIPPFAVFGMKSQPALLLGTDLLETFSRVSLDFRARRVRFQLRKCGSTGITISTMPGGFASRIHAAENDPVCR